MTQIKQHLSDLIGHGRGVDMPCGQWRTPPPRPDRLRQPPFRNFRPSGGDARRDRAPLDAGCERRRGAR
jgi:hypothetical protein